LPGDLASLILRSLIPGSLIKYGLTGLRGGIYNCSRDCGALLYGMATLGTRRSKCSSYSGSTGSFRDRGGIVSLSGVRASIPDPPSKESPKQATAMNDRLAHDTLFRAELVRTSWDLQIPIQRIVPNVF
jgi:hypothetical protein